MENKTLIEKSLLNNYDKELLINMVNNNLYPKNLFNLSIFSKLGIEYKINNYIYIKYDNNIYFYNKKINIWMDNEFKLLPYSNWWCDTDLQRFINHINIYLLYIQNININNAIFITGNFISITKWFNTYGHFLDEISCLKEFLMNEEFKNNYPFISFNLNINNIYNNSNYKDFCDLLFEKYYDPINDLTKVNNIIIIKHLYNDVTFHSFSKSVTNFILNKININNEKIFNNSISNEYLFITRGEDPPHLPRNLKNKKEIENYFLKKNICVFNPEQHNIYDMIKIIKNYNNIIITWGSALTNLCFCNDNSNIIILKSDSYKDENIKLFEKIINDRKLIIHIIESINNIIEIKYIDLLI